jgi:tetraacyldisaccharide 4'-kinase
VLVLDDGFQHRRLYRDLDIVCFDCGDPKLRLLPAGRLREPVASLSRADAIVLTGYREGCRPPTRFDKPVLRSITRVVGFSRLDGGERLSADAFHGRPVALAVGIARPERARESLDADVVTFETRRDHHSWSASELEAIAAGASGKGAQALLVTGKDAVKLEESTAVALPIYRIDIESEISDPSALGALLDGVASLPPLAVLG